MGMSWVISIKIAAEIFLTTFLEIFTVFLQLHIGNTPLDKLTISLVFDMNIPSTVSLEILSEISVGIFLDARIPHRILRKILPGFGSKSPQDPPQKRTRILLKIPQGFCQKSYQDSAQNHTMVLLRILPGFCSESSKDSAQNFPRILIKVLP